MRTICTHEAPVLRATARALSPKEIVADETQTLIADMRVLLSKEKNGVAIAAPQVGASVRLFVVSGHVYALTKEEEFDPRVHKDRVFINPQIISRSRAQTPLHEGCLSVRAEKSGTMIWGTVRRHEKVTLVAFDEHGNPVRVGASGLLAQIFQHEVDHLDGILYIDRTDDVYEDDEA